MQNEVKVVSAETPIVQQLLEDFRVKSDGKMKIGSMEGEGRLRRKQDKDSERKVLIRWKTEEEWRAERPPIFVRWLTAARLNYLLFSILPMLLVFTYTFRVRPVLDAWAVLGMLAATVLLHLGCNLWNDYEDHMRGVDAPESSGGSGVIRKLWIPAVHIKWVAAALFGAGILFGLLLLTRMSWADQGKVLLGLGLIGAFGAATYSGWPFHVKYYALGEAVMFVLSGPLLCLAGATAILGMNTPFLELFLYSLPVGVLAILRLHAINMRRIPYDTQAGVKTLASLVGFNQAKKLYVGGIALLYLLPIVLNEFYAAPIFSWLFIVTLPFAIKISKRMLALKGPMDPHTSALSSNTEKLHFGFVVLYCIGLLV